MGTHVKMLVLCVAGRLERCVGRYACPGEHRVLPAAAWPAMGGLEPLLPGQSLDAYVLRRTVELFSKRTSVASGESTLLGNKPAGPASGCLCTCVRDPTCLHVGSRCRIGNPLLQWGGVWTAVQK